MSKDIVLARINNKLTQHYEAEWTMKNILLNSCESMRSASFAPIPGVPVEFCWDVWSRASVLSNRSTAIVYFKLILVKSAGFNIPSTLQMKIDVKVNIRSETVIEYKNDTPIFVHNMMPVTCINTTLECLKHDQDFRTHNCHYRKMRENPLTVISSFIYFGHLSSPLMHCHHMRSLRILEHFMKDFGAIYNIGLLSDMTILVGDKKLRVHKSVLIAHSPVMRQMLEHDFAESKTNTLNIVDTDYEIFDCFLKFLYSGQIEDRNWSTVKQLYILADKYNVQTLQKQCTEIIESQMSVDNLCEILKMAYNYNSHDKNELKEKAKQFAAIHLTELVGKSEWKEMVLSDPQIGFDVTAVVYLPQTSEYNDTSKKVKLQNKSSN